MITLIILSLYNRCTKDGFNGKTIDVSTRRDCEINTKTGIFPTTCRFIPTGTRGTKASLLFAEHLDSVSCIKTFYNNDVTYHL